VFVVGTSGHVDHGKSTLVQALTGINPDRLREEQEREMTIDLGFAWMSLPSGREISLVDVPGHEDFIKNMLAGVGGIDVALLVVAADEAVMPQTREHLAILDLLRVAQGLVVLTKSDLVLDPEWLELVQEEVREELAGSVLADAPIVPVSAVTGAGLPALVAELDRLLDGALPRPDLGRPRLPIDRIFTMSGFGTVVTGTLSDGRLQVGQEVALLPGGLRARIRGLQSHRARVNEVAPGARVAANLTGVDTSDLTRGQVLCLPNTLQATQLIDAAFRLLPSSPWPLKHNTQVEFFLGAARVPARVRLLDAESLEPGQTGWAQFCLESPLVALRGDRYVVRLASPSITLGGGVVVQPQPARRHQRFRPAVLAQLQALAQGDPEQVLLHQLGTRIIPWRALVQASGLPAEVAERAARSLVGRAALIVLAETDADRSIPASAGVLSRSSWETSLARAESELRAYQQRFPLRAGMPRQELRSRLQLGAEFWGVWLERAVSEGRVRADTNEVCTPDHVVQLSDQQQTAVDRVLRAFAENPEQPPSQAQVESWLDADVLQHLVDTGRLVRSSEGVLFSGSEFQRMEQQLVAHLAAHDTATVAEVRDLLNTSRKYALAFLEETDRRRVTKRMGDVRVAR
jgi:selenocysteine-specific elongation factor